MRKEEDRDGVHASTTETNVVVVINIIIMIIIIIVVVVTIVLMDVRRAVDVVSLRIRWW